MTSPDEEYIDPHGECAAEIERLREELRALREWELRARIMIIEAREMVVDWAGYASAYFRDRHDLTGDLAKIDAFIGPLS